MKISIVETLKGEQELQAQQVQPDTNDLCKHDYDDLKVAKQAVANRLSVDRERHALEMEMQVTQAQQCELEEQEHLLI